MHHAINWLNPNALDVRHWKSVNKRQNILKSKLKKTTPPIEKNRFLLDDQPGEQGDNQQV